MFSQVGSVGRVLVAATVVSGCYSWSVPDEPAVRQLRGEPPQEVRVTRASSGERAELEEARVREDSLVGTNREDRRVALPLSDVDRVEVREFDLGETALLTGGVLVVGTFVAWGIALREGIEDIGEGSSR